jgi:glycerate 2-kinase
MKIVLAPNAFKESLGAVEFVDILGEALQSADPSIEVVKTPLADGGDGTLEVVARLWEGREESFETVDPLRRPIYAPVAFDRKEKTALIELATTSGLAQLQLPERNPLETTTFGFGLLINQLLDRGVQRIFLCIGGSATVDGGTGMAEALGFQHMDRSHAPLAGCGGHLNKIHCVIPPADLDRIRGVEYVVLSDVTNPLHGPNGAACVFGPQKGASPEQVDLLDRGLRHLAGVWARDLGRNVEDVPGSGAAGGIGGGAIVYLGAHLVPGGEWILEMVRFKELLSTADLVITGEGRLDSTTLQGKLPGRVAAMAMQAGVKCIGLCGAMDRGTREDLLAGGFSEVCTLAPEGTPKHESFARAGEFLRERGREIGLRGIHK